MMICECATVIGVSSHDFQLLVFLEDPVHAMITRCTLDVKYDVHSMV